MRYVAWGSSWAVTNCSCATAKFKQATIWSNGLSARLRISLAQDQIIERTAAALELNVMFAEADRKTRRRIMSELTICAFRLHRLPCSSTRDDFVKPTTYSRSRAGGDQYAFKSSCGTRARHGGEGSRVLLTRAGPRCYVCAFGR
jgi:hypothetical protein